MSDNERDGRQSYANGDQSTRDWFHKQWRVWPRRADDRFTTNGSFHYGAVVAYREENNSDPEMSKEFASHVRVMDGFKT